MFTKNIDAPQPATGVSVQWQERIAMANGFLTERPTERYGAAQGGGIAGWVWCQKFTAPTAGEIDLTEIGCCLQDSGDNFRMAVFTDDSGNTCPDAMVSNSESATLSAPLTQTITYHTYSGTKPRLTGGTAYWICLYDGASINVSYVSGASVTGLNVSGYTSLYTWPTGDNWHTHTDRNTIDWSFYAVYEAAAGATKAIPPAILSRQRDAFHHMIIR